MRPTFLGLEAGRKGLAVAQKGLDITGQNLNNIATPGYTRQRIDQVSVSAFGVTSRAPGNRVDFAGQGVAITGVSQIRNSYLDRRFREEFSENFYYQQKVDILSDISAVVDQYSQSGEGLTLAVQELSKALQGLTGDMSTDRTSINILRTAFQGMVQTLHDYDARLDKVMGQHKNDLNIDKDEVNKMLEKLAGLNEQIRNEVAVNPSDSNVYSPNELVDERNLLLDELSRYVDLQTTENVDGTVDVKIGDYLVVTGDYADKLQVYEHPSGNVSLIWNSTGSEAKLTSGSLKASVEMINGRGPDLQSPYESPEKGVLYYKDQLNTFARTLAQVMNGVLPGALDPEGKPMVDPNTGEEFKSLLEASIIDDNGKRVTSKDVEITAANISISDAWANEVTYALPSATSKANSEYFSKMNTLLTKDAKTVFATRGQTFVGTFADFIEDIHSTCVGEESFYQSRLYATGAIADDLLNQRDAISGVSKDEETVNMMMYQKSFQAVSRLMTTMDEALDVIINRMGLVGR